MYSKKIEQLLTKVVNNYLKNVLPDSPYWRGNHTWKEMVAFREEFGKLANKTGFKESDQQTILKWGGINKFSSFDLMKTSLQEIKNGELTHDTYSRISSMSKLFSFYKPELYFILDARVALSLNNLIISNRTEDKLIPFNPNKSKGGKVRMALLRQQDKSQEYQNMGIAYLAYNDLILRVFKRIHIPNKLTQKPELVEMVLFSMATDLTK